MERFVDRQVWSTGSGVTVALNASGNTVWTLPYTVNVDQTTDGTLLAVREDTGAEVSITRPAANQAEAVGDLRGVTMVFGLLYGLKYKMTRLYFRDEEGKPETQGRTTVRYLDIHYSESSDFEVVVRADGREEYREWMGVGGSSALQSGTMRVPIQSRNEQVEIEIFHWGPNGVYLLGADWEGTHVQRTKRF